MMCSEVLGQECTELGYQSRIPVLTSHWRQNSRGTMEDCFSGHVFVFLNSFALFLLYLT